jgi:SAM-dependent methyltransferase
VTFSNSMPCPYCRTANEPDYRYAGPMTVCASCGAWFVWPRPTASSRQEYYEKNRAGMPGQLRDWRRDTSQGSWYRFLAQRVATHAIFRDIKSVADIGAGALELATALDRRLDAHVEAWDLFADGLPASSIPCRQIDLNRLDDAPPPGATFDVVTCVAVIEHVVDPLALLRFLRSITAPGGFAYVVGPDAGSIARRLLRTKWPYYCPDEHITIPTLTSIKRALAIAGGGAYRLRRMSVRYSLKYLLRFLRVPLPVPDPLDIVLRVPAGAFELVWSRD